MNKLGQNIPPLKKMRLSKKAQKEEDEIKRKIHEANQYWNDWEFQIHWNKLDWLNPRSRDKQKNSFCVSSKNNCFKNNVKTTHRVGH